LSTAPYDAPEDTARDSWTPPCAPGSGSRSCIRCCIRCVAAARPDPGRRPRDRGEPGPRRAVRPSGAGASDR